MFAYPFPLDTLANHQYIACARAIVNRPIPTYTIIHVHFSLQIRFHVPITTLCLYSTIRKQSSQLYERSKAKVQREGEFE